MSNVTERFFEALWGDREGYRELRGINEGKVIINEFRLSTPSMASSVQDHILEGNLFCGVLLRDASVGNAEHCEKETEWLWADVDIKSGGSFSHILMRAGIPPQMVVDSGHGWHLYWHLDEPVPVAEAQRAMQVLADAVGGDAVGDPARIMRIPGTYNLKDGMMVPVRMLRYDPITRHKFSNFDMPVRPGRILTRTFDEGTWEVSPEDAPKFPEGGRNVGLLKLAGGMKAKGLDYEVMREALLAENDIRCDPPLDEREVLNIVRSVSRY